MSFDCSTCDPSYTWSGFNETTCYAFAQEPATSPVTPLYLTASTNSAYSEYGTKIYSTNYLVSGVGNLMSIETDLVWKNLSANNIDGPLNRSGRWLSGVTINDKWIGFSTCVTGTTAGKTYYIGIGSDNHYKVVINGTEILNNYTQNSIYESFIFWHVYPVTLYGGDNIIEVYGLNSGDTASIGCEIYDNTYSQLSGATQYSDLNVVYTTSGLTGVTVVQDLSGQYLSSGYTCPEGYYYNACSGTCVEKIYCTESGPCRCLRFRIDYRDLMDATGNTSNPNNTIFGVGQYNCDYSPIDETFTAPGYYCYCMALNPPPSICFNFSLTEDPPSEFVYTTASGSYNDKIYYEIFDGETSIGFVWWNSGTSLWNFSTSLGGGDLYSTLDNSLDPQLGEYPISSTGYEWAGDISFVGMLNSFEEQCPPTLCITYSSNTYDEYTCTTTPSGYYNEKVYYQVLDNDCLTQSGLFIYWSTSNSRWECGSSLGGGTLHSYLENPGSTPLSNITYPWVGLSGTLNVIESVNGVCSEISCAIEGYGFSIDTPFTLSFIPSSPDSIISNLPPLGYSIDLYYYKDDVLTYTTYSSVVLTDDECSESSDCCNDICNVSGYCISNTDNEYLNGFYINSGIYEERPYWSGVSTNLVIYYSTERTQWCLSTSLGGPCLIAGKTPCYSVCPDFCDDIINDGYCTTTTTLPFVDCELLDFDAIFNCHVDPTPTPTPTNTPTPSPTPGGSIPPCVITVEAEINTYSPTPTPTPTITPSPSSQFSRDCGFTGNVKFNTINDTLGCPTNRQFQDCENGVIYNTMNSVLTPSSLTLVESMVYGATVNGLNKCLIYLGVNNNISGNSTITITSESFGSTTSGGCLSCQED